MRRCADQSGIAIDSALVALAEAVIDLVEGDVDAAHARVHDVLPVFAAEPCPLEIVDAFSLLGGVAAARGARLDAARWWGVADAVAARHEIAWAPLRPWTDATRAEARTACGPSEFDRAAAEGESLTVDEAVAWARSTSHAPPNG